MAQLTINANTQTGLATLWVLACTSLQTAVVIT